MSPSDKRRDMFEKKLARKKVPGSSATARSTGLRGLLETSFTGKARGSAGAYAKAVVGGALLGCAIATPAAAQSDRRGEILARKWCASCHIVAPDQRSAQDGVPSFAGIARSSHHAGKKLAPFLLTQHPRLPGVVLSQREARDLAAYIKSKARR